jgi:hypothetical protein
MWQYNNVSFIYDNRVGSEFGQTVTIPFIRTYLKSKYALMEALRAHVDESFLGPYTEINPRTVKYDKPIKI